MIYLNKILPLIFSPLFLIISLIILGTIMRLKKISLLGIIILIICSLPIVSNNLIGYLERNHFYQATEEISRADAIVVLGGIIKTIKVNDKLKYEFNGGVDRILSGIDLFKNNKAPLLILTRGKLPWSIGIPEGEYLKDFAIELGVPSEKILLTDKVENTDQEAKSVKKLLNIDKDKIILITSAFHMPRAKKIFEASNLTVIPFAVDLKYFYEKITFLNFIPSAESFGTTSFAIREMIGRLYYYIKY
ncbi:YdcF family protein [Candidatus Pelagibacter bacterium]|jgi:uncharacterized SAM-binding protein YcdF (DUF218 family)|nr:YdcF family protein [Candidatus Pelagibacter bacterium]